MAKKFVLTKTSINKINKFSKNFKLDNIIKENFEKFLLNEVKSLKDCSETIIIDYYLEDSAVLLNNNFSINDDFYSIITEKVRNRLVQKYTTNKQFDNLIDIYFNEVKKEYIRHPVTEQDELEVLPENRDIFIKNNLKLVIECAKRYQNLGLPFEDLIQAGNYGLLIAWDKYDKDRANLRHKIINTIKNSIYSYFSHTDAEDIIRDSFSYSKNLQQTLDKLPEDGFDTKEDFITWVKKNVKTAVFASVAFQWIRAYIVIELNKYSKVIRPKKVKDANNKTVNESVTIINLDSFNPHTEDCYHDNQLNEAQNDEFILEDEQIEKNERQDVFKSIINSALYKLDPLSCRIVKKRFGINMPYELSISEIAETEGLSTNKIKYILTISLKSIAESINPKDKETLMEMLG